MINGKIEIILEEAGLLHKIAAHYLEGWSLLRLADMAEQSGILCTVNMVFLIAASHFYKIDF